MTTLLAILFLAALFAAYALVRPRFGCRSDCGACERPCRTLELHNDAEQS